MAQFTTLCDKCGKAGLSDGVHTLPDGWEQWGYGDNLCPACIKPMQEALDNISKNEANKDEPYPEYIPGVTWPTEYCGEVWASTWAKYKKEGD
jgi:hypothetical protein